MENPNFEVVVSGEEYETRKVAIGGAVKTWLTNIQETRNWKQIKKHGSLNYPAQETVNELYDPEAEDNRERILEPLIDYFDRMDAWMTDAKALIDEIKESLKDTPIPEEETMKLFPFTYIAELTPMKDIAQFILQELTEKRIFLGITPTLGDESMHLPDMQIITLNGRRDKMRYVSVIDQFDPFQCWQEERDHIWAYASLYSFYDMVMLDQNSPLKTKAVTPQDVEPHFIELDNGISSTIMYLTSFPDLPNTE